MAKYTKPMYFKFDYNLWLELQKKENHNAWVRDACYEKLKRENNTDLLKKKIDEHRDAIKEIENLIKQIKEEQKGNGHKVNEVLTTWFSDYKDKRVMYEDRFNLTWISDKILPELKKLGCTSFSAKQILELFYNNHKEGKVLIDV